MAKRARRRHRRRWGRTLLATAFLAAAVYAGVYCFLRPPEVPAAEAAAPAETAEPQSTAEALAAQALAAHTARKDNFYTILLSGCDDGNGNSDTNILVAVDAENDYIYGVSIARDTKAVWNGKSHKINAAYGSGGVEKLAEVVSHQLGIPVDYTVSVDLRGFVALVDQIGGVTFDVPIDMDYEDPYQDLYIHIPAGVQTLNGEEALKVVRFRKGYASQDIGRMETQQAFLKAAAKQLLRPENLLNVDKFVNIFQQYVKTDLSLGNLAWLGKEAISMGADAISFSTLPGEWNERDGYIHLDIDETLTLVNTWLNPYVEDRVTADLNIPT